MEHRSGLIAVIGRPNVGKSTLINSLVGQKVAAVSPRPQTTRRRQLGIVTRPEAQLVMIDTPGMHEPRHKLGAFMNDEAESSLEGADVILLLVDLTVAPSDPDAQVAALLKSLRRPVPIVLAANKSDLVDGQLASERMERYLEPLPDRAQCILISALQGDRLGQLVELLIASCPARPPEFSEDQVTDLYEREIAADLIREACLLKLRDEVPHGLAVRMDEYTERDTGVDYIRATLLLERESQKGIVIGHGGSMLKQIGTAARAQIEQMTGRRVFLELRAKVEKGWRNRESVLEQLGYKFRR